jgi:hypothetical protein
MRLVRGGELVRPRCQPAETEGPESAGRAEGRGPEVIERSREQGVGRFSPREAWHGCGTEMGKVPADERCRSPSMDGSRVDSRATPLSRRGDCQLTEPISPS